MRIWRIFIYFFFIAENIYKRKKTPWSSCSSFFSSLAGAGAETISGAGAGAGARAGAETGAGAGAGERAAERGAPLGVGGEKVGGAAGGGAVHGASERGRAA